MLHLDDALSWETLHRSFSICAFPAGFQADDSAGVLKTADGRRVAYCVSVVDAGPKPPTKLAGKAKKERDIWEFVAGLGEAAFV